MTLKKVKLYGTTNGSGALTVVDTKATFGRLYAVEWIDGTLDNGGGGVLSCIRTGSGVDQTLLTLANPLIDADAWYYPRVQEHSQAGAALTFDGTRTKNDSMPVINGTLQLAITSGGATKVGGCIVYYLE